MRIPKPYEKPKPKKCSKCGKEFKDTDKKMRDKENSDWQHEHCYFNE